MKKNVVFNYFLFYYYAQAGSLWLMIKSAELREHEKVANFVLPKVLGLWAYDAFATFGTFAMILAGFGYATLCCCRDSCLNFVSI